MALVMPDTSRVHAMAMNPVGGERVDRRYCGDQYRIDVHTCPHPVRSGFTRWRWRALLRITFLTD